MKISFDDLEGADLIIDCIYEGGNQGGTRADPLSKLFPKCGNLGGFRKVNRADGSGKPAYVVLTTTMSELEWPDYIDEETGNNRIGFRKAPFRNAGWLTGSLIEGTNTHPVIQTQDCLQAI